MGVAADGKFYIEGYVQIPAEKFDSMLPIWEGHVALSRQEALCERFDHAVDEQVMGRIHFKEIYLGEEGFEAQMARSAPSEWGVSSKGMPRNITFLDDKPDWA